MGPGLWQRVALIHFHLSGQDIGSVASLQNTRGRGGREEGEEGGRGERKGGREGRGGGREGGRERGREEGREGGREGASGREGGREGRGGMEQIEGEYNHVDSSS